MNYTPGPWYVQIGKNIDPDARVIDAQDVGVAHCYQHPLDDDGTSLANAHLIAAAPDMYEALVYALDELYAYQADLMDDPESNLSGIDQAILLAQDALNKAEEKEVSQ